MWIVRRLKKDRAMILKTKKMKTPMNEYFLMAKNTDLDKIRVDRSVLHSFPIRIQSSEISHLGRTGLPKV